MSCSGPLWVPLVWYSLCLLDLCGFFSHQIKDTFHHYFFSVSIPHSSSPSGFPIIWIVFHFMLPCISLNPSSFFSSLFFFLLLFLRGFFYFALQLTNLILCFFLCFWLFLLCSLIQKLYSLFLLGSCWLFLCPFFCWYSL